jgi:hypothetical protein
MNVFFTSAMVLAFRSGYQTFRSGGKRFIVLSTPINCKPVYRVPHRK